jgi:hypothetical protein
MNATPPEANTEYSRAAVVSGGVSQARSDAAEGRSAAAAGVFSVGILAGGLIGALLLIAAEFTTLFKVRIAASTTIVKTVSTGSHHSYAMAVIAVCAAALAIGTWRTAGRPGLVAIGVLGVAALVIALVVDLPDATSSGLVLSASSYANASSTPSTGFYLETLGALVLMFTSMWGLLLVGPPARTPAPTQTPAPAQTPAPVQKPVRLLIGREGRQSDNDPPAPS